MTRDLGEIVWGVEGGDRGTREVVQGSIESFLSPSLLLLFPSPPLLSVPLFSLLPSLCLSVSPSLCLFPFFLFFSLDHVFSSGQVRGEASFSFFPLSNHTDRASWFCGSAPSHLHSIGDLPLSQLTPPGCLSIYANSEDTPLPFYVLFRRLNPSPTLMNSSEKNILRALVSFYLCDFQLGDIWETLLEA